MGRLWAMVVVWLGYGKCIGGLWKAYSWVTVLYWRAMVSIHKCMVSVWGYST